MLFSNKVVVSIWVVVLGLVALSAPGAIVARNLLWLFFGGIVTPAIAWMIAAKLWKRATATTLLDARALTDGQRYGVTMTHTVESPRLKAFERLLVRPDRKDLTLRAHVIRWEGELNLRSTRLPAIMMAWQQPRFVDRDEAFPYAATVWTRRASAR
jgi:hypothetical protein